MFDLVGNVRGVVSGTSNWVEGQWSQRIIQISVCAALLFYVLSAEDLINTVDKYVLDMFSVKMGKNGTRVLHAVTFGIFMYIGVRFLLDGILKRLLGTVEGMEEEVEGYEAEEAEVEGYEAEEEEVGIAPVDGS